jgi:hypothetical protein
MARASCAGFFSIFIETAFGVATSAAAVVPVEVPVLSLVDVEVDVLADLLWPFDASAGLWDALCPRALSSLPRCPPSDPGR